VTRLRVRCSQGEAKVRALPVRHVASRADPVEGCDADVKVELEVAGILRQVLTPDLAFDGGRS
jgi:hypothetical protein